jgi:NAD(P)-dependent dehydrogenase (short-subunit alcohol dehydrogenase family)/putative sterol carrier protein
MNKHQSLSSSSLLSGKVAIITGAGNGLGLAYAHALASHGCQLVINDIAVVTSSTSSSSHGTVHTHSATIIGHDHVATGTKKKHVADQVVNELRSKYKRDNVAIVANYSPVSYEGAQEILNSALQAFGRVDILINNAGIVRDRVFEKTSEKDWNMLTEVHLNGVYRLSQLVYSQFLKQIVQQEENNTIATSVVSVPVASASVPIASASVPVAASAAAAAMDHNHDRPSVHNGTNTYKILFVSSIAVYGSFGQTAYSALKSAIIGLCHSLACETQKRHLPIHVNAIMPLADSGMLRTSHLPEHVYDMLPVDSILPAIVYLVSALCQENGGIFELAGGIMYRVYIQRSSVAIPIVNNVYELHKLWTNSNNSNSNNSNNSNNNAPVSTHIYKNSEEAMVHLLETIANPPVPPSLTASSNEHDKYSSRTTFGTLSSSSQTIGTTTTTRTRTGIENKRTMEQNLKELFETIKNNLAGMPKDEKLPPNTFVYVLSNDKRYLLDLKNRALRQLSNEGEDANVKGDVTITMSDEDFIKLMNGQAQPQQLFFAKKLKISGNMGLAMKMISIREKLVNNASEGQQPLKSKL